MGTFTWKPRPESGLACLMCAILLTAGVAPKYLLQTLTKRLLTDKQLMEVGTSLIRNRLPLGPYSRPMPRAQRKSW